MKIANFSVERPVAISMVIIALLLVGLVSLPRLRVDLFPDMNMPMALVMAEYEGASPAEVENLVTKPLESSLATVNKVSEFMSYSQPGTSVIGIMFDWGTDMDRATLDMREKIDLVKGYLPDEVKTPMVYKMDMNAMPVMIFAVSGSDLSEMKRIAEDIVKPKLERIEGVATVNVSGGREKEIKVLLNQAKLQAYGLTAGQVMMAISSDNIAGTGGSVARGTGDLDIRVIGEYKEVSDLENVAVTLATGSTLRLADLADIKEDYKKTERLSYVNGKPSVGISLMKETGSNTVQVANHVNEAVQEMQKQLPATVTLHTVMDSSIYIRDTINTLVEHALLGGLLAVLVLYLFLKSFRSTIVVVMVIPIAVVGTFSMMYFGGQTINMLSMGGLALGLGSLVDFSVVVLESIFRHRQEGYSVIEAAKQGTAEVGMAVTASATTQVVVFMPIVFVQGLSGIIFGPMALTVSFSHIAALFAALTLVPMIASRMMKVTFSEDAKTGSNSNGRLIYLLHLPAEKFGRQYRAFTGQYARLLDWSLRHRKTVVLFTTGLLVGACLLMVTVVGTEFIPQMDQGQVSINIQMPHGAQFDETGKMVGRVESIAASFPEVDTIFSNVGSGGEFAMIGGGAAELATLTVKLTPLNKREISTDQMVEELRNQLSMIAGAEFTVQVASDMNMGLGDPISIYIRGDDLNVLKELGDMVVDEIKTVPGARNVKSSLEDAKPEMQIQLDRQRASQYGITAAHVLSSVRTAFDGQVVSRLRTGTDEIDIRILYPENYRQDINNVSNTIITSPTGAKVTVGEVAAVGVKQAPINITRYNNIRYVTVGVDFTGRDLGSMNRDIQAKLNNLKFPAGYNTELTGQAAEMQDTFGDLGFAIILAIALVYMVMAFQFESLFYPFVIMFSIPPTIIGVALGLLLTGHHLSVPAIIGYIMLVGIVVNNAIVLIDYVNTLRKRGLSRDEALRKAGPIRLRPILMTTLSTVLALLPLAFLGGEGKEVQAPLAVVVSFGLTLATMVTLVLIPVVYTILDDIGTSLSNKLTRFIRRENITITK